MEKIKKICFILPTLHAGGVENYTLRFLNSVKGRFDVTIVSKNTLKGDLHDKFVETGAKIIYRSFGYFNLSSMLFLYRLFIKSKFDTICDFTGNFGGIPMYIAKKAGVSNRITFYRRSTIAFTPTTFRKAYNNFVNRLVYKYSTAILSNSRFAFENFFSQVYHLDERFRIIPNGVNANNFRFTETKQELRKKNNLPENAVIVGHVGRLDPAKNHPVILEVMQRIMSENKEICLVLCGKGTDAPLFVEKIKATGFSERIFPLGLRSNVAEIYKTFDVFFFPSLTEGQPNALIEAMMSEVPVVASNIAPITEATPADIHEYFVAPTDVAGFKNMLLRVINEDLLKERLTKSEWATKHFDPEVNFKLFENEL